MLAVRQYVQNIFLKQISAKIGGLLSADIQYFLTGYIENAAKIFNMRVKQAAPGFFAHNQYGNFFAGRMNRRL
jgi:hypothetical protein